MTSSDVEDERVELDCRVVREGGVAGATETARTRRAAASSRGGEVEGGADDARLALPSHMVDMAKRSSTKLTPEQVAKMEKLLTEYQARCPRPWLHVFGSALH